MNTSYILIILAILILVAYLFDEIAKKTRFPSVILLIITGMGIRSFVEFFTDLDYEFLNTVVPLLGTIGLIMIVLEEALELKINKQKLPIIIKGLLASVVLLLANLYLLSWIFQKFFQFDYPSAVMYSIPLAVLSSAVAIPSASVLLKIDKEFVVYETTFSDILGIAIFYYAIDQFSVGKPVNSANEIMDLLGLILIISVISFVLTLLLKRVMQVIGNQNKFFLILAILLGIYGLGKQMHYPVLLTIFIFGVILNNAPRLIPRFINKKLKVTPYDRGLYDFKLLTVGFSFLVRIFFFLFFGFSILYYEFNSYKPFAIGLGLFLVMFVVRWVYFSILKLKLSFNPTPILYIAPRGLISILLFLEIGVIKDFNVDGKGIVDEKLLLIVILTSMVFMLAGTMKKKKDVLIKEDEEESVQSDVESEVVSEDAFEETSSEARPFDENDNDERLEPDTT